MKTFLVIRDEDISGVSGTGIVAEGVQFTDGKIIISWLGKMHTLEIHPDMETFLKIHGHDGRTKVRFLLGRH